MIAISVTDLSLAFGTDVILENITFALDEKDKVGVIGVNGCGKSTLLKLITGEYESTSGQVYLSRGKTVGILSQEGAFSHDGENGSEEQTALEHVYHAFPHLLRAEARLAELEKQTADPNNSPAEHERLAREYSALLEAFIADGGMEFRSRAAAILMKLGFDEALSATPVCHLSGGQRTRLALGIQLARAPDVLLLDEPTNHLDIETLAWLESFLADYPKCVIVVSHDRYFLDRVTTKTLCIQNGKAKLYSGGYTKSMEQRRIDREIQEKHYKDQQKEIARQEAYIAQQRAWNRERNIIAAESRQKMLDRMERVERPDRDPTPIRLSFTASGPSGQDVLHLRDVSMGFGERELFSHLDLLVKRMDRLLILGGNGCGKSTLIKLLLGQLTPRGGVIETGYNVEIGYYDQENQSLDPSNTVLDELWNRYPRMTETEIRNALGQFRFVGEDVFKPVSVLSGGERARLTLCKLILSKMNLLILDEPTNHLDMDSREALESALEQFDGTIVAVSHDRYFIEKLATRILEIRRGGGATGDFTDFRIDHNGKAYSEYRAFMENRAARLAPTAMGESSSAPKPATTSSKEDYQKAKQAAADARKRQHRLEKLKAEAASLEAELEEIEALLCGEAATDYIKAAELDARRTAAEERLMEVYEELENEGNEGNDTGNPS